MAGIASERDALIDALAFQAEAGVDLALDDAPQDRFATATPLAEDVALPEAEPGRASREKPPFPPSAARPRPAGRGGTEPGLAAATVDAARLAAGAAATLDELRAALASFDGCGLKRSARQIVFLDGAPGSALMILGEAPGIEEDRIGRPFVGRAGRLLDRMLAAIELDRTSVLLANAVPWRPPGNRSPTAQEVAVCLPFAQRLVELARPRLLLTLGSATSGAILGSTEPIGRLRGRWVEYRIGTLDVRVRPTLDPGTLLRKPGSKRQAWQDLRAVRWALDEQL